MVSLDTTGYLEGGKWSQIGASGVFSTDVAFTMRDPRPDPGFILPRSTVAIIELLPHHSDPGGG